MKPQTKKQIKQAATNFGLNLLGAIVEVAKAMPQPLESKSAYQRRVWRQMRDYPLRRVQSGLSRLEKQGHIKSTTKHPQIMQLTLTGRSKLLMQRIYLHKKINKKIATIVLFDIPEEKSRHRKFLRRLLLNNGFINLQKSAMIGRFDLPPEFIDLISDLQIRQNVTIIKGIVEYK